MSNSCNLKKKLDVLWFSFLQYRLEVETPRPRHDRVVSDFVLHGTVLITNFSVSASEDTSWLLLTVWIAFPESASAIISSRQPCLASMELPTSIGPYKQTSHISTVFHTSEMRWKIFIRNAPYVSHVKNLTDVLCSQHFIQLDTILNIRLKFQCMKP